MRKMARRLHRITPEDRLLNGLLILIAVALIVVGVWRMGSEARAGSTEVLTKATVRSTSTTTTSTTTTTTAAPVTAGAPPATPPTSVAPARRARRHRATTTTTALRVVSVPPVAAIAPTQPPAPPAPPRPRRRRVRRPPRRSRRPRPRGHDRATRSRTDRAVVDARASDRGAPAGAAAVLFASYMARSARSRRWSADSCGLAVAIPMLAVIAPPSYQGCCSATQDPVGDARAAPPRRQGREHDEELVAAEPTDRPGAVEARARSGPRPRSAPRHRARGRGGR